MEQLVARRAHNPKVVSSSLAPATQKSNQKWLLFFGYDKVGSSKKRIIDSLGHWLDACFFKTHERYTDPISEAKMQSELTLNRFKGEGSRLTIVFIKVDDVDEKLSPLRGFNAIHYVLVHLVASYR